MALNPNLPEAYHALALPYYYKDYPENLRSLFRYDKLALALDPNLASALSMLAELCIWLGKPSRAQPLLDRLKQVDPLNPAIYTLTGYVYLLDGKYALAIEQFEKRLQLDPTPFEQFFKAWALACNKQITEAVALIDQSAEAAPGHLNAKLGQLLKYGVLKDREKAFEVMSPDFQRTCKRDLVSSYYAASMLSLLDANPEALDWLENAVNQGFINYPALRRRTRFLASIRGEERFKKLVERVKYEWEHFEE